MLRSILLALTVLLSGPAHAATIGTLDLSRLSFELTQDRLTGRGPVLGLSNGLGFTLAVTSYETARSTQKNTFVFNDLPGAYDNLTLWRNFTITFDAPIRGILFALARFSSFLDGPDFAAVPRDSTGISLSGTQLVIDDRGGALAYIEFATPVTTITQTDRGRKDAFALAFFATPVTPVPVPVAPSLALLGSALGLLGLARWRR